MTHLIRGRETTNNQVSNKALKKLVTNNIFYCCHKIRVTRKLETGQVSMGTDDRLISVKRVIKNVLSIFDHSNIKDNKDLITTDAVINCKCFEILLQKQILFYNYLHPQR